MARARATLEDVFLRLTADDREPPHDRLQLLLRKELAEAWQTRRLPVVVGLFVVVGIVSPLTARYLREIMQAAIGDELTTRSHADRRDGGRQLQKNLAQLGALAAIALAMSSVSGELDREPRRWCWRSP